jgi:iron complex transport system permease protein
VVAASAAGAAAGPVHVPLGAVLGAVLTPPFLHAQSAADSGQWAILWSLRFPRVVLGALVGGMLATAGAAYQGVFRNPCLLYNLTLPTKA